MPVFNFHKLTIISVFFISLFLDKLCIGIQIEGADEM